MKVLWAIQKFAVNDDDGRDIPLAIKEINQEITILEKSNDIGGICKTVNYKGFDFDYKYFI